MLFCLCLNLDLATSSSEQPQVLLAVLILPQSGRSMGVAPWATSVSGPPGRGERGKNLAIDYLLKTLFYNLG